MSLRVEWVMSGISRYDSKKRNTMKAFLCHSRTLFELFTDGCECDRIRDKWDDLGINTTQEDIFTPFLAVHKKLTLTSHMVEEYLSCFASGLYNDPLRSMGTASRIFL